MAVLVRVVAVALPIMQVVGHQVVAVVILVVVLAGWVAPAVALVGLILHW